MYLNIIEDPNEKVKAQEKYDKIEKRIFVPTSRNDISYMLNDKVRVVSYKELENFNSLRELLHPYMNVVILYPNPGDETVGHWCAVFSNTNGDRVEFFDSYGCYIDSKIEENDDYDDMMHRPHKLEPTLCRLILESDYENIHWNDTSYQNLSTDSATCGLWVVVRIKNKHLNEEAFKRQYYDLPIEGGQRPDRVVSTVICNLFPEMNIPG